MREIFEKLILTFTRHLHSDPEIVLIDKNRLVIRDDLEGLIKIVFIEQSKIVCQKRLEIDKPKLTVVE